MEEKSAGCNRQMGDFKRRVLDAIGHRQPDWVPCDYWGTPEVDRMLMDHFGADSIDGVREKLGTDIRYIYASGIIYEDPEGLYGPTPRYIGPKRQAFEDGSFEDLWGVTRKFVQVTSGNTYREVIRNPLKEMATVGEIEAYENWPRSQDFDYSNLREECERQKDYALIVGGMPGCATVFIQCWYLRGLDQILMDLVLSPEMAHAIIARITEFQLEYHRRLLEEIGDLVDILMLADDYGTQTSLMMSPDHFRTFFRKPTLDLIELGKRYGMKIMLHSDGNIRKLIPDFIEMGIDILNPIQNVCPEMDPGHLKGEFGRDICFHGGMDTQEVLPHISPEEVVNEVRKQIEVLGKDGGYILSPTHMLQLDVPKENILAMYRTLRDISSGEF